MHHKHATLTVNYSPEKCYELIKIPTPTQNMSLNNQLIFQLQQILTRILN